MNVLSLFDGMSCGRIALHRAGIHVDKYFSSEIDKHALKVADANWPCDTLNRLGDVTKIDTKYAPKIDLLIGGSPCQSFSFAGTRKGMSTKEGEEITTLERYLELKTGGFEFEGYSYLFWEYIRLLMELKPKYFLLENVQVPKKWRSVIDSTLGCVPIKINSSTMSAQSRTRLYWTNIPNVNQPTDKGLFLRDVWKHEEAKDITDTVLAKVPGTEAHKKTFSACVTLDMKSKCLMTGGQGVANSGATNVWISGRYYAPSIETIECLQTVPANYTDVPDVSNREREKMLGNGWTVDVIAHILKGIRNPNV